MKPGTLAPLPEVAAPRPDAPGSTDTPGRTDVSGRTDAPGRNTPATRGEELLTEQVHVAALEQRLADLEASLDHRERQIEAMRRTSEALFVHSSVEDMIRETLSLAIEVFCADAGSLLLHDAEKDVLVFRFVVGPAAPTLTGYTMPSSQGIAGQVFQSGISDLTQQVRERADFNSKVDEETGYQTNSMMTVPVKRPGGSPIGVMQILNAQYPPFGPRDLEVLEVLCDQAAAAIENAHLSEQARKAEIVNVLGDISHDIKNMLTPIQTGVWTLESMLDDLFNELDEICNETGADATITGKIHQSADMVRDDYGWILQNAADAAIKVQARTKEIADAIKGEAAAPNFEAGDINETAREVTQSLRLVAESNGLLLELDLDENLPAVEFDQKQMYNALYNLVNNAIPETPSGGKVTIRTSVPDGRDEEILVQVRDTGKGIPEHVRARLFTAGAISTKPGGTGLGTRIVAGVVQRHNGVIKVDSEIGKGSTFSISLPLRQPNA